VLGRAAIIKQEFPRRESRVAYDGSMISSAEPDAAVQEVLAFWFGEGKERGQSRTQWFRKDPAFDEEIRARFLAVYDRAVAGEFEAWTQHAAGCLALVVVLDQFPRNLFRGNRRAFEADAMARKVTRLALAREFDRTLRPVERMFIYLPFEHSEHLPDQELCLRLMKELSGFRETREMHVWAEKHLAIIRRFGRFPHRNAALGRSSTAEESEFLKQPGSGF
jgi:uncharacterized protein (DUF924 family)